MTGGTRDVAVRLAEASDEELARLLLARAVSPGVDWRDLFDAAESLLSEAALARADFGTGVWPAVGLVVYVAPILAFVMLLTVLISTLVRRSRANRSQ